MIPNPSFETYTICPGGSGGQVESAVPWSAATTTSSTDYFNACSTVAPVPNIGTAYQYPNTGNAFVGFFFLQGSYPNTREYLQVRLITPLVQNATYYVEFFVNLHDANFASPCNSIAANFSVVRPFTTNLGDIQPLAPHIMNPGNPIISDRINWVQVSGCYLAQGGEEYLTIGNFMDDANTQTTGTTASSYYFVDDVRVEEIAGVCVNGINELSANHNLRVYPNPNNGTFSIAYTFEQAGQEFILYDLVGKEVVHTALESNEGTKQLSNSNLNAGIYFYKILNGNKILFTGKLVINK